MMKFQVELAEVSRRVNVRAAKSAQAAIARIDAPTPSELRDGLRKHPEVEAAEAMGRAWRRMLDGWAAFGNAFARGLGGGVS